jgi:hypothetical protein
MDALEGLSDDDDSGSSSSGSGDEGGSGSNGEGGSGDAKKQKAADGKAVAASGAAKKKEITLDDLQAQGFRTGPSVLYMKPPDEGQQNWNWCAV